MLKLELKRAVLSVALLLLVSLVQAGPMVVRVQARDYWELYDHIQFKGTSIDIAGKVAGESYDLVLDRADLPLVMASGLAMEVVVDDIDTRRGEAALDGYYCSHDSIVSIMRNWATTYPDICKFDSIGRTYYGRWIYGVKISDNVQVEEDEPEVLFESLHHSREWACPQAARHFGDTLLANYATNSEFQDFIDNHQLWLFPIINVDGYDYDYPGQRMWRKDRQPFGGSVGTDPNRDYNGCCNGNRMSDWGALTSGSASSHEPSSDVFMGAHAMFGDEVDALAEFFKQHTFVADVSLHSYSELVLWPFGNGFTAPDDAMLSGLGQGMALRMSRLSGGTYTPEQASSLYPTSGGSIDWMYGWAHNVGGFPCMSYVFELGTRFYQNTGDLESIQKECFDGAFYLFTHADSIIDNLEGEVPPPVLAPLDSSATGDFTIHWSPVRPEHNHPDKWELEELTGLTVTTDDIESGSGLWDFEGFSLSTSQHHSGSNSVFSGSANNISNYMVTKDPYPVQSGDSLTFWLWYNLETNYDVFVAEVSENLLEWTQLHERYEGNASSWQREAFSLEPWVGRSVYLRFRVMTDDYTLRTGAYVDDVYPVPAFSGHTVIADNITDTLYSVTGKTPGTYYYRVRGHNAAWAWNNQGPLEDIVVTASGGAEGPAEPQSFKTALTVGANPSTGPFELSYTLRRAGDISLMVFDASGRTVRTLVAGTAAAGRHSARWDGRDTQGRKLAAGVYFCRLDADETVTARVVLLD